jgi:hypothetical protein
MNRALTCLCLLMLSAAPKFCAAQDNANTEAKPKGEATTPIKIQVVFAEFDGEKKTKSLPYTIYHNTTHGSLLQTDFTKLRLSTPFRIPVGPNNSRNIDLATNLDCRAVRYDDGRFLVQLSADRSWVEEETINVARTPATGSQTTSNAEDLSKQPVVRSVRIDVYLSLRDGQTVETVAATDPITGRVFRIDATLNVLK